MNANISRLYDNLLQLAASSQTLGINLIRVPIQIDDDQDRHTDQVDAQGLRGGCQLQ